MAAEGLAVRAASVLTLRIVHLRAFVLAFLLFSTATTVASPPDTLRPECPASWTYARLGLHDLTNTVTAPVRFSTRDWLLTGGAAVVIGGVMAGVDDPAQHFFQSNRSDASDWVADRFNSFGSYYPGWILAGFYVTGLVTRNRTAQLVALDGVPASFISLGTVELIKKTVGRYRPWEKRGPHTFDSWSGHDSFPSGHTILAFTNASVIAAHYRQPWVKIVAYGVATLVAYARMDYDVHWLSDTMAGACLGLAIGHGIVMLNAHLRAARQPESR